MIFNWLQMFKISIRGWAKFWLLSEFTRISFFNQTFSMQFQIWIGMGTIWLPNSFIFNFIIYNRDSFQNFVNIWNNIYVCSWLLTNNWFPFNDCGNKSETIQPEAQSVQQEARISRARILAIPAHNSCKIFQRLKISPEILTTCSLQQAHQYSNAWKLSEKINI